MKKYKEIVVTLFGGLATFFTFLAGCPGLACAGCGAACFTPILSIFGLSLSGLLVSGIWEVLQPLLIALSAVLYTVAYFSIYKKQSVSELCFAQTCNSQLTKSKQSGKAVKLFFWISLGISIILFSYTIKSRIAPKDIAINSLNNTPTILKSDTAFFDADFLYWDKVKKSFICKGSLDSLATKIYGLHEYARKNNIPVLLTTCCSFNMPVKNELNNTGVLYIPLDSVDNSWKENVPQSLIFYVAKEAYGNPKMNYDKNATCTFKKNHNLSSLLDILKIKNWVVFGAGFELCTSNDMKGLLDKGYNVTVIQDMITSSANGNDKTKNAILSDYIKKGVKVVNLREFLKSRKTK